MKLFRSVAVALTLVFMACLVLPGQILAAPMTLRYACHHGPTDIHSKLIEAWIAEVEKRTDGKLKIDFYPGQSLVKAPQTYDAVLNGMTDIGFFDSSVHSRPLPADGLHQSATRLLQCPGQYRNNQRGSGEISA